MFLKAGEGLERHNLERSSWRNCVSCQSDGFGQELVPFYRMLITGVDHVDTSPTAASGVGNLLLHIA